MEKKSWRASHGDLGGTSAMRLGEASNYKAGVGDYTADKPLKHGADTNTSTNQHTNSRMNSLGGLF